MMQNAAERRFAEQVEEERRLNHELHQQDVTNLQDLSELDEEETRERQISRAAHDWTFARTPEAKLEARAQLDALGVSLADLPSSRLRPAAPLRLPRVITVRISGLGPDGSFEAQPA